MLFLIEMISHTSLNMIPTFWTAIDYTQNLQLTKIIISFPDLVLKDKIFVYDLANQRIGWMNYDCKSDHQQFPVFFYLHTRRNTNVVSILVFMQALNLSMLVQLLVRTNT